MSRILSFVLTGTVVVLGVLTFSLIKLIPLERPEVFFLRQQTRSPNMIIVPMDPSNERMLRFYYYGFIREYIIARNTLVPGIDANITRDNWANVVKPWSSKEVFEQFQDTRLYKKYTFDTIPPALLCSVNFDNTNKERSIVDMPGGRYEVKFIWVCKDENSGRQTIQKNYKIQIRIQSDLESKVSGALDNLEILRKNPLGIQIVEYKIKDDQDDPLNSNTGSR